ncbi:hypothetical protein GOODEAATRI_011546 [Goodea atripinnis]|uniref:Secreted protein n=1 Tax=Goodea atripinnis TaxID=208336 RepID=A0ABV0PX66_9TELE
MCAIINCSIRKHTCFLGTVCASATAMSGWQMEDCCGLQPRSLSSVGRTGGINQLGFESSQIIWRLTMRVPVVKSRLAFPDGNADSAQYVPLHSVERGTRAVVAVF